MVDRRTFMGTASAVMLAGPSTWLGASPLRRPAQDNRIRSIGLQLYTVRDEMAKDFDGTLARVAALGYKEVEFAGYFNRSPKDVRAVLDRHGLTSPATHVDLKTLRENLPQVIETAGIAGHQFVVLPWLDDAARQQPDVWKRVADTLNAAAAAGSKSSVQFAYHNHHFEFAPADGKLPYDVLLDSCDPAVKMELDLCWITAAGKDPVAYFQRYPGRFPMVHVKDLKKVPAGPTPGALPIDQILPDVTDVGSGSIDWKRIFAQSTTAGIRHYFVEHDRPARPFESLETSYKYLRNLTF
jgi:sugar phosphate isomerase/epimerase